MLPTNKGMVKNRTPIFIITHDRVQVLKESIISYHQNIDDPFEIIIHDNLSTYPALLRVLKEFEKLGGKVYYNQTNELNDVRHTITNYWKTSNCDANCYVVTDPDISLFNTNNDILEFYKHLLIKYPDVTVVGPMLKIDDIPDHYGLKDVVLAEHGKKHWSKSTKTVHWKGQPYQIQNDIIDTIFGLYRREFEFKRQNIGIRTRGPYTARHLDWYMNTGHLTDEQEYYKKSGYKWGNWSSQMLVAESTIRHIRITTPSITVSEDYNTVRYNNSTGMSVLISQ